MPDCKNKAYETPNILLPLEQAVFFVEGVRLVQSCPMHSSHIQLCSWKPTDAAASIIIHFLFLVCFFFKRPEIANKGFVKKPWPVPHQHSPSCLPLKFHFCFPACGAPCSVCVCGVLCAAAGEQPWVTGAPACLRQQPQQVRARVLPSSCLPGSLQFHFKQLMVPKGKEGMWRF